MGQSEISFLNEGIDGKTEYQFYWDRNVLAVWFYVGADRRRKSTALTRPETLTAEFRAEARRRATGIVQSARAGRVLVARPADRVQVPSTVRELREAWLKEQLLQYPDSYKTRFIQSNNVVVVFEEIHDDLTPLQRMVVDDGPQTFVDTRMRQVAKSTVIKEVGVLFHFLDWMKRKRFITVVPPRPRYRPKDPGTRVGPQRSEPVHLEDDVALKIIKRLPEYTSRGGRKGGKLPAASFVCRDMMRFAFETGLRPSTVARLRAGVHWSRATNVLRITPDIDKSRNEGLARKVRIVPLTTVAKAILMKHCPGSGFIFGKHDIRVQWKRAAIAVLGEDEGSRCAPYDLRHGANYRMRDLGGSVTGAMHMVGHARATTNDLYLRGTEKAAAEVVEKLNARNRELESVRKAVRKRSSSVGTRR